ncbi:MAG TPA: MarR family transcriptional regulator [Candidatus Acidoferrales bacterium]|nr:MarR family transcriptional regulator [Candidatus Acidoferrales bacterium]
MTNEDYRALAEFRYQIRTFLNLSEQASRAAGLEPQHHQLLLALKGLPAGSRATVGYLAERLHLQHHSLVELIDRLESRRLVRRVRSRNDRRVVHIYITRRGEKVLGELSVHHRNLVRTAGPALVRSLEYILAAGGGYYRTHRTDGRSGSKQRTARAMKSH